MPLLARLKQLFLTLLPARPTQPDLSRFTDRSRIAMARAKHAALRLHSPQLCSDHILLGLLDQDCLATRILRHLNIDPQPLYQLTEAYTRHYDTDPAFAALLDAKQVVQCALAEADRLHSAHCGTEHLLLAILRDTANRGALPLYALGLTHEKADAALTAILSPTPAT